MNLCGSRGVEWGSHSFPAQTAKGVMNMIWSKRERSGLPALKLLFGLLLLVLLAACGEDEPALTKPTTALEPVMTQVSPLALEMSNGSTSTSPADWVHQEATYYSFSHPAGWQVEEGFGGQYVALHPAEDAGAGEIGKIELAYLGYEIAPKDNLLEWYNLYETLAGGEIPERQILENRSEVQPDGTVTRRLHALTSDEHGLSQVILLTHGRLVLSLNAYTHDQSMTALLRTLADSITFHSDAPRTKAELYPDEKELVTTLDEVVAIGQAPPSPLLPVGVVTLTNPIVIPTAQPPATEWTRYTSPLGFSLEYPSGWHLEVEETWATERTSDLWIAPIADYSSPEVIRIHTWLHPEVVDGLASPYNAVPNEGGYNVYWPTPITLSKAKGLLYVWGKENNLTIGGKWAMLPTLYVSFYSPILDTEVQIIGGDFDDESTLRAQRIGLAATVAERYPIFDHMMKSIRFLPPGEAAPATPEATISTTLSSPLTEVGQTAQVTVPDAYTGAYHYQVTYPTEEWRLETTETRGGPDYPELEHLAITGCRMYLREGPRGLQHYGETILAGNSWNLYIVGEIYPNHLVYSLPQDDKGMSFIIGLDWPPDASDEVKAACQAAAEAVLDTFTLVD